MTNEMNDHLESSQLEHRNTTPHWPQANGEVKIKNKSINKRLKITQAENKDLKSELQKISDHV